MNIENEIIITKHLIYPNLGINKKGFGKPSK